MTPEKPKFHENDQEKLRMTLLHEPSNAFGPAAELLETIVARVDQLTIEVSDLKSDLEAVREGWGWMTVKQTAEHSGMSPHAVYRLLYEADRNGLEAEKVVTKVGGSRWRVHRARWDRWLEAQGIW